MEKDAKEVVFNDRAYSSDDILEKLGEEKKDGKYEKDKVEEFGFGEDGKIDDSKKVKQAVGIETISVRKIS